MFDIKDLYNPNIPDNYVIMSRPSDLAKVARKFITGDEKLPLKDKALTPITIVVYMETENGWTRKKEYATFYMFGSKFETEELAREYYAGIVDLKPTNPVALWYFNDIWYVTPYDDPRAPWASFVLGARVDLVPYMCPAPEAVEDITAALFPDLTAFPRVSGLPLGLRYADSKTIEMKDLRFIRQYWNKMVRNLKLIKQAEKDAYAEVLGWSNPVPDEPLGMIPPKGVRVRPNRYQALADSSEDEVDSEAESLPTPSVDSSEPAADNSSECGEPKEKRKHRKHRSKRGGKASRSIKSQISQGISRAESELASEKTTVSDKETQSSPPARKAEKPLPTTNISSEQPASIRTGIDVPSLEGYIFPLRDNVDTRHVYTKTKYYASALDHRDGDRVGIFMETARETVKYDKDVRAYDQMASKMYHDGCTVAQVVVRFEQLNIDHSDDVLIKDPTQQTPDETWTTETFKGQVIVEALLDLTSPKICNPQFSREEVWKAMSARYGYSSGSNHPAWLVNDLTLYIAFWSYCNAGSLDFRLGPVSRQKLRSVFSTGTSLTKAVWALAQDLLKQTFVIVAGKLGVEIVRRAILQLGQVLGISSDLLQIITTGALSFIAFISAWVECIPEGATWRSEISPNSSETGLSRILSRFLPIRTSVFKAGWITLTILMPAGWSCLVYGTAWAAATIYKHFSNILDAARSLRAKSIWNGKLLDSSIPDLTTRNVSLDPFQKPSSASSTNESLSSSSTSPSQTDPPISRKPWARMVHFMQRTIQHLNPNSPLNLWQRAKSSFITTWAVNAIILGATLGLLICATLCSAFYSAVMSVLIAMLPTELTQLVCRAKCLLLWGMDLLTSWCSSSLSQENMAQFAHSLKETMGSSLQTLI